MTMHIFPFDESDIDSFVEFRKKAKEEWETLREITREDALDILADTELTPFLIFDNIKIAGQLFVILEKGFCFIELISVLKEYYGTGIASLLIEKAKEFTKKHNLNIIELNVKGTNNRALKFYENEGFKKYKINRLGNITMRMYMPRD